MMNSGRRKARGAWALAVRVAAMATLGASLPAQAQDADRQAPSGAVANPVGAGPAAGSADPGLPEATPMTDLLTRMDTLEAQVARLTAQNEELANRQREIEAKLAAAGSGAEPAAAAPANPVAAATPPTVAPGTPAPLASGAATAANLSAMAGGTADRAGEDRVPGPARPTAQRLAAVKAVIKPQTGEPGLDEYTYGFRLYTAKFYPEAAQQLKFYIEKYPRDAFVSHARNLLGRAYLDDGKPRDAAPWFLTNYKTDPHGARAADSLLNLAEAMHELGDSNRACIALNEFATTYVSEAKGRLRQDYGKTRGALICH